MIQWILVALILAATLLYIIRRCKKKRKPRCASCPLASVCR